MLISIVNNRRFIATGLLIFFALGFLGFFTESDTLSPIFQSFIVSIIFFLVIPILYSKIVLKEPLKNIGWQRGNMVAGVLTGVVSVVLAGASIIGLTILFPDFSAQQRLPLFVEIHFGWFLAYELVLVTVTVLFYEVFFRGLVQLSWLQSLGVWGIVIQTVLFYALIYFSQDISWAMAPFLIFCPLAGYIAYRSQSIWYSSIASWAFLFLTDIFLLVYR